MHFLVHSDPIYSAGLISYITPIRSVGRNTTSVLINCIGLGIRMCVCQDRVGTELNLTAGGRLWGQHLLYFSNHFCNAAVYSTVQCMC